MEIVHVEVAVACSCVQGQVHIFIYVYIAFFSPKSKTCTYRERQISPVPNIIGSIHQQFTWWYHDMLNWHLGHAPNYILHMHQNHFVLQFSSAHSSRRFCPGTVHEGFRLPKVLNISRLIFWGCRPWVPDRFKESHKPFIGPIPCHSISCMQVFLFGLCNLIRFQYTCNAINLSRPWPHSVGSLESHETRHPWVQHGLVAGCICVCVCDSIFPHIGAHK